MRVIGSYIVDDSVYTTVVSDYEYPVVLISKANTDPELVKKFRELFGLKLNYEDLHDL